MTKNVQIAVSSVLQSTVRKPPFFIIKTDRIRTIYEMGTKIAKVNTVPTFINDLMYHVCSIKMKIKIHTICKEILLTLTQLIKQSFNSMMLCD
jgi:hypothetical protein